MHIVKAIHIIYIKNIYNIVYAYDAFQVWLSSVEGVHLLTEGHQDVAISILGQARVVL